MNEHPEGASVSKENAVFLLNAIDEKNNYQANYSCQLKNNVFKVIIHRSGVFSVLSKDDNPVYKFTDIYPSDNNIYGLNSTIKKYYLKLSSDGKAIECITRNGEQQVCDENIVNKIKSKPSNFMSASFPCNKAKTTTEKSICANPELSRLDYKLSESYKKAYSISPQKDSLKREQLLWLKERDTCKDDNCLMVKYKSRIKELKSINK